MATHTLPDEPSSQSTSTNLLKHIVAGDREAWVRFVSIYGAFIYARCRRAGVLPHDSADLVQEVLKRVLKSISTLRRDQPGQGLRLWLRTISTNVINDHFRKLRKEREAFGLAAFQGILDEFPSPWDENSNSWAATPDVVLVLRQAMECVKIDYEVKTWQAFWRTVVDEQPTAEVAMELGLAQGTVRQARYKILKRLREELEGLL